MSIMRSNMVNMLYFISCVVNIACFYFCLYLSFHEWPRMLTKCLVKYLTIFFSKKHKREAGRVKLLLCIHDNDLGFINKLCFCSNLVDLQT